MFRIKYDSGIDKCGFPSAEGAKYTVSLRSGAKTVMCPVGFGFAPRTVAAAASAVCLFHAIEIFSIFVPTHQKGRGLTPPFGIRQTAISRLTLIFQILKVILKLIPFRILVGFFLLPFKRFGCLFRNLPITNTKILFYFEKTNKKSKYTDAKIQTEI